MNDARYAPDRPGGVIALPDAPRQLQGEIMPPGGAPDFEIAALMERLNKLQTWVTLLACRQVGGATEAMSVVQDTRCLIVERLYPGAKR